MRVVAQRLLDVPHKHSCYCATVLRANYITPHVGYSLLSDTIDVSRCMQIDCRGTPVASVRIELALLALRTFKLQHVCLFTSCLRRGTPLH